MIVAGYLLGRYEIRFALHPAGIRLDRVLRLGHEEDRHTPHPHILPNHICIGSFVGPVQRAQETHNIVLGLNTMIEFLATYASWDAYADVADIVPYRGPA